jgi:hypothetical protein
MRELGQARNIPATVHLRARKQRQAYLPLTRVFSAFCSHAGIIRRYGDRGGVKVREKLVKTENSGSLKIP